MQLSNRQCRSSISALRQHSRETLTHAGFPKTLPLLGGRTSVIVRSYNDDLVDVQSGQLPRGTAAAPAAAGDAAARSLGYSPNNPSAGQARKNVQNPSNLLGRISPVLVLAGAATAILCGVTLVWLSTTGALNPAAGSADGVQLSNISAAAGVMAQKSAAALGDVLHHLWVTLAEVSSCMFAPQFPPQVLSCQQYIVLPTCIAVPHCCHPLGPACCPDRLAALLACHLYTPQPCSTPSWTPAPLAGSSNCSSTLEPSVHCSSSCCSCAVGEQGQTAGRESCSQVCGIGWKCGVCRPLCPEGPAASAWSTATTLASCFLVSLMAAAVGSNVCHDIFSLPQVHLDHIQSHQYIHHLVMWLSLQG